jgi:hypothetical protein
VKTIGAIIAVILCALPAVLAGVPSLQPAWFAARTGGVPNSVIAMSALMLAFVVLAGIFSAIAARAPAAKAGA